MAELNAQHQPMASRGRSPSYNRSYPGGYAGRMVMREVWRGLRIVILAVVAMLLLAPQSSFATLRGSVMPAAMSASTPPPTVDARRYAPNLAIISVHGPITAVTARSFERRVRAALDSGADAIVVDINSPGGEVGAVLEICAQIKRSGVHTIAWINPMAFSGGAIIAIACDEIIVSTGASMGDAAPVRLGMLGIERIEDPEIRQKLLAPLLTEIVDSARANGYDEVLVQGLLSLGVETWQVEHTPTGRLYFLTEPEYRRIFGTEPQRGAPTIPSGSPTAGLASPPTQTGTVQQDPTTGVEGLTPATGEFTRELVEEVTQNLTQPGRRQDIYAFPADEFRVIGYATDGNTLLTMSADQLHQFGFTRHQQAVDTDEQLRALTGATNIARLNQSWSETFTGVMTQGMLGMMIRTILIVVFLLALFIELSMPGTGVGGTIALVALAGLIVPPLMIGAASWWAIAAILVGVGLIVLELLVFPGMGIPGIAGLISLIAGLVGTFAGAGQIFPGVNGGNNDLAWAVSSVLLAIFAAGVGMFFLTRYTRAIPIAKGLILDTPTSSAGNTILGAMAGATVSGPVRIGERGVTTTPLLPSGRAEFDGRLVDVVSEYGFVDAGADVRVTSVTQYRVGVEAVPPGSETGNAAPPEASA
ncbi:MAG: hypothetical protein EA380_11060 [Phycisphaeraceae bacterium]|nr:MAG: hypothetical protein EA380_11060 [Phycisphaeraceae bacterium]